MKKNYQVESFKRCTNSDQQLGFLIATLDRVVSEKYPPDESDFADARAVLDFIKQQNAEFWVVANAKISAGIKGLLGDAP